MRGLTATGSGNEKTLWGIVENKGELWKANLNDGKESLSKSKNGAPFGEKRLHQLVLKSSPKNSAAFVSIVGSYLEKYREGAPNSEDLTLLTLKAQG